MGRWNQLFVGVVLVASIAAGQTKQPATTSKTHKKTTVSSHSSKTASTYRPKASARSSSAHARKGTAARIRHTSASSSSRHRAARQSASWRTRGQQQPDSERATQIQSALIREHYLTGEPSGAWDPATEEAMQRYQADHGWQTKTTPDARALITLGLGPDQKHLLNPDTAVTSAPASTAPASAAAVDGGPSSAPVNAAGPAVSNSQPQR